MISKNLKLSSQSNIIITNSRHLEALNNSLKAIESVNKGLKEGLSGDLLSIDLNDAIINISIITGKIDIDQEYPWVDILQVLYWEISTFY